MFLISLQEFSACLRKALEELLPIAVVVARASKGGRSFCLSQENPNDCLPEHPIVASSFLLLL